MWNARLDESQAGIKIAGRNSNFRYADDTTLMAENEEKLKGSLKMKVEREKAGLKLNIPKTKIMASGPIASWQIEKEKVEAVTNFIFLGSKIIANHDCSHEIKRRLLFGRKAMTKLDIMFKSRDITLPTKVHLVNIMVFQVRMWVLVPKEAGVPKNWCFQTVVLKKALESPLDNKDIKPANPKRNPHWIFIGRIDAEADAPIFWPSDVNNWLIGKDSEAGEDWRYEENRVAENTIVGWHHQFNEQEFECLGGSGGQRSLACCSLWVLNSQTQFRDWRKQITMKTNKSKKLQV